MPTPLPASALSALKTTTGSSTAMLSENAISKDAYPISTTLNPTNTAPVAWPAAAAGRPTLTGGMTSGRIAGAFAPFFFPLSRASALAKNYNFCGVGVGVEKARHRR